MRERFCIATGCKKVNVSKGYCMKHRRQILGPFPSDSKESKVKSDTRMKRRKGMPIFKAERNARSLEYNAKVKGRALSHYSKDGIIKCQAEGCEVNDPDMLSLDHINNDGAKDRKLGRGYAGVALYGMLEREKFPEGFQTLCFNHQSKKELERRRAHALSTIILSYLVPTMFFTSYGKDLQCQTQS